MQKNVLLEHNFQVEGHFEGHLLIYILTIYRECVLFQLFSRGIRMHSPNNGSKRTRHRVEKWS